MSTNRQPDSKPTVRENGIFRGALIDVDVITSRLPDKVRHKRPPFKVALSQWAAVFTHGLGDMAGPAKSLEPVRVEWVLVRFVVQPEDMIGFQASSPTALDKRQPSRSKTGTAGGSPPVGIQVAMMSAHGLLNSVVFSILCPISCRYTSSAPGQISIENITTRSAKFRSMVWL